MSSEAQSLIGLYLGVVIPSWSPIYYTSVHWTPRWYLYAQYFLLENPVTVVKGEKVKDLNGVSDAYRRRLSRIIATLSFNSISDILLRWWKGERRKRTLSRVLYYKTSCCTNNRQCWICNAENNYSLTSTVRMACHLRGTCTILFGARWGGSLVRGCIGHCRMM